MQKKNILIFLALILFLSNASAFTTTLSGSGTSRTASITQTTDLYAYEINLDYSGTINSVTHSNFLGPTSEATYGYNEKNNVLSVYGSRLDSTRTGVSGSGELFNVTFSDSVSLRYTLEIYANESEIYTYYNTSAVPTPGDNTGGGSGGGGGGQANEFDISPNMIRIILKQGETKRETVTLTNKLTTPIEISSISGSDDLNKFIAGYLPDPPITLLPGESTNLDIDFFARENETPETYIGKITIKGGGTTKTINTIIEIQEKEPLFDVTVNLEKNQYSPGETTIATIQIENFGDLKNIDVLLHYALKDFEGNILTFQEGSYAIENYKLQVIGKLKVPIDTKVGDYIFYAKATYPRQGISAATGSQVFTVGDFGLSPVFGPGNTFLLILILIILIAIVVVTIILYLGSRKKKQLEMIKS
ncbi:MAG: hypothetical protein KJ718_01125 [Nanoarchaeota archaeon]|nr:hypothetical protein [Nanoarchaeota archaeon]MBU1051135.1 hypothetical protein [Nanoarchaeota archaeon]MBU1988533.1 hypothetical protein [Nanoarchaeota archaeon]